MKNKYTILLFGLLFLCAVPSQSQRLIDGFFNEQGSLSLTAGYTHTNYDEFYVGEMKVTGVPALGEVDQDIFNLYATYSILDDLTVIASVPYFIAKGKDGADPVNGEDKISDFQDIDIALKYRLHQFNMDSGYLNFLVAAGITIPTGYEPNGILSLGSGSFNNTYNLGFHYQDNSGVFVSALGGYSFRGKADNNFNTNNGGDFDVPNAVLFTGRIGYAGSLFYLEAFADVQSAVDGVDIMGPGFAGNFPETEVDYTVLGLSAYVPILDNLGISGSYGTLVAGRNIGDTNYFNVGVTYNLGLGAGSSGGGGSTSN